MRKKGLLVIFLLLAAFGCKDKIKPGEEKVARPVVSGVKVESVGLSSVDDYYDTSGTVKAKTVSIVASRVMGTVTALRAKEGDRVGAGHVLLTIDDSDVAMKFKGATDGYLEAKKALESAAENRRLADITYQRYSRLYDDKALTGQEFDQIKSRKRMADIDYERTKASVDRAEAGMEEVRVFRGFTRVTSPVAGIVTERKVELGSMAIPGVPLMIVEDNSAYRVDINVDERLMSRLRPGMEADVSLESVKGFLKGRVTEVVPSVDPASRSFLVKIALKDEALRSGLYAKVSVPVGKKETLLVPKGSIVERGQLTGVYVVGKDSVIAYRLVRVGRSYGDRVEVLTGLNPGEKVIVSGTEKAADGGLVVGAERVDK